MTEEERRGYMTNKIMSQPYNKMTRDQARQCVDIGQSAVEAALDAVMQRCSTSISRTDSILNALETLQSALPELLDTTIAVKIEEIAREVLGIGEGTPGGMFSTGCECESCTEARKLVDGGKARVLVEGDGFAFLVIDGGAVN